MAAEGITLVCTECKMENYRKLKNKKTNPDRLTLNKYCPKCRKANEHIEKKK
jgi:large subunit ribosomal protein L33